MNTNQNESFVTLNLSVNDTNIVVAALRELPHRVVSELIPNIMEQVKKQIPSAYQAPVYVHNPN